MYIGGAHTDGLARSHGSALGAPAAPGSAPVLSAAALKKAVTLNRVYARTIGWKDHVGQIAFRLGLMDKNPDIWSFIQAVANWQASHGIMPSGALGGEWHDLLTRNR